MSKETLVARERWVRRATLTSLSLALLAAGQLPAQKDATPFMHVAGRVVAADGEPLAGVAIAVVARESFVDMPRLLASPRTRTDEQGRYRVALTKDERGSWMVYAKQGLQAVVCTMPWQTVDGTDRRADVVLVPGVELVGRLRAPDGAPVADARVSLASAIRSSYAGSDQHVSGALSDARGFFRVPCVAPTALDLSVSHAAYLSHAQLASRTTPLDIRMTPAEVVEVRCVDADGAPIAGIAPTVQTVFGSRSDRDHPSDADGRLRVTVPAGRPFRLLAAQYDVVTRSARTAPLLPGDGEVVLRLVPSKESRRVVHLVARDDASGEVIERVRVRPVPMSADMAAAAVMHAALTTPQEVDGECDFHVSQYTNSVLVEAPGYGYALAPCKAEHTDVEVRLRPECVLRGTVIDAASGKPAADVAVRVLPLGRVAGGSGQSADGPPRTDENGRYEIRGLPAGEHTAQVHVVGSPATESVAVKLVADKPAELDLELPVPAPLTVVVSDALEERASGGPRVWLHHQDVVSLPSTARNFFTHSNPATPPRAVTSAGNYEFVPMGSADDVVFARTPSRHRAATFAARQVFGSGARRGPVRLDELQVVSVRGSIAATEALPFERIGLLAVPLQVDPQWGNGRVEPIKRAKTFAGVDDEGRFAIDLMPCEHDLHLVDLLTDIVFWSSSEPVRPGKAPLVLRPTIRWLDVTCEPLEPDQAVVVPPFGLRVQDRNGRRLRGELHPAPEFVWPPGIQRQRWLVPSCKLTITIPDAFAELRGDGEALPDAPLFSRTLDIERQHQSLAIRLPAPPGKQ